MTRLTAEQRLSRRPRDPRKLNVTIRLVAPRGTPRATLIAAIEQSIRESRVVPPLRAIHAVDWKKGEGAHAHAGQYVPPEMWDALKDFYAAITHPNTKLRIGLAE